MFVVAAMVLTSATYAWVVTISHPDVRDIDLYVTAPEAMMLSALSTPVLNNADDWMVSIDKSEIMNPLRGNQANAFPNSIADVSSVFSEVSPIFYKPNYMADGSLLGYEPTTNQNQFTKFSLWAKSTRSGFVYLDEDSSITATGGTVLQNSVVEAIRMGIVPVDYDENGSAPGGMIAGEAWQYAVIWEPHTKSHIPQVNGGPGGNDKLNTFAISGINPSDTALQVTFDYGNTNINVTDYYDGKTIPSQVNVLDPNAKIALFNLNTDSMQKFNVYIWVEGADADTVDAVAKSYFNTYIKFGQDFDKFKGSEFKATN